MRCGLQGVCAQQRLGADRRVLVPPGTAVQQVRLKAPCRVHTAHDTCMTPTCEPQQDSYGRCSDDRVWFQGLVTIGLKRTLMTALRKGSASTSS